MNRNLDTCKRLGKGLVELDFSFALNNTSSPLMSTLQGTDAGVVASLTRNGVGIVTVLLKPDVQCRSIALKEVDLDDLDSSDDGAYASSGPPLNVASLTLGVSFKVYTRAAAGTKTDYASPRRCNVRLVMKNSTVGS